MYQVIIVVHVLLGLGVVGLILMQQGKGADAGAAFGSGSSGSVFGAQGASSFLSRTTAILATLFFSTSLSLAVLSSNQSEQRDLMDVPEIEQPKADVPLVGDVPAIVTPETPIIEDATAIPTPPEVIPVVDPTVTLEPVTSETPVVPATATPAVITPPEVNIQPLAEPELNPVPVPSATTPAENSTTTPNIVPDKDVVVGE